MRSDWAEFLAAIDGPRELHDCYRVNKDGRPTFDAVMAGIGFLKKHGVEFNTLRVVNQKNSYHAFEHSRESVGHGHPRQSSGQ